MIRSFFVAMALPAVLHAQGFSPIQQGQMQQSVREMQSRIWMQQWQQVTRQQQMQMYQMRRVQKARAQDLEAAARSRVGMAEQELPQPSGVQWRIFDLEEGEVPTYDGTRLVARVKGDKLRSIDPMTGKAQWEVPFKEKLSLPPVLLGDWVVAANESWELLILEAGTGKLLHRIKMDDWKDFQFITRRINHPKVLFPILEEGRLIVGTYGKGASLKAEGRLHAYDPASGKALWDLPIPGGPDFGPVVQDGKVLTGGNGQVLALDPKDGKQLWSVAFGRPKELGAGQVVAGRLLVSCGDQLMAVEAASGTRLWTAKAYADAFVLGEGDHVLAFAEITSTGPFSQGTRAWIMALDARTGKQLWERKLGASQVPWIQDGRVYCNADEKLLALDLATGKPVWTLEHHQAPKMPILPVGNALVVADEYQGETLLKALDPATGKAKWTFTLQGGTAGGLTLPVGTGFILPLPGGQIDLLR
ncbi:MAG TPA: PQQ-binding-like beta-propeller repeat protein [Holophagaceae bacterium]|nr:PQQ-binding-like beta-propeller repeat protein [Holophagaceae bacterium]